jgi:hypothetical protein
MVYLAGFFGSRCSSGMMKISIISGEPSRVHLPRPKLDVGTIGIELASVSWHLFNRLMPAL